MKRHTLLTLIAITGALTSACAAQETVVAAQGKGENAKAQKPLAYEADIVAFEKADAANPPVKGGVVFIGSSSIRRWKNLQQDFPNINAINRGFGGSQIEDSVNFAQRIVTPYEPKMVVFYAGSNDVAKGKSPEKALADYQAFVAQVREKLPNVPIAFIAISPAPKRASVLESVKKTNALIEQFSNLVPNLKFVDIFPLMLDAKGQMRPELYVSDRLHMSPAGYEIWIKALTPILPKP